MVRFIPGYALKSVGATRFLKIIHHGFPILVASKRRECGGEIRGQISSLAPRRAAQLGSMPRPTPHEK
jgi:hypothetical protein